MSERPSSRLWLFRLVLFAFSLGFALVVSEIAVRIAVPVRNVGPSWTMHHPAYFQAVKPNLHVRRRSPEFDTMFTTNSLGFRGAEPLSTPSETIVFLGDSFTMGYGVTDGEEYPRVAGDRLEAALGEAAPLVVNAGIGRGNGYWVKFLREEAADYTPRYVVLMASSNDARDNRREKLFKLEDGELVALPVLRPSSLRVAQAWLERIPLINETYLYGLSRQLQLRASAAPVASEAAAPGKSGAAKAWHDDLTLALMDEALAICAERGWPVLLATADMTEQEVEGVAGIAAARGVPYLRIPAKRERPDLYFEVDGHWTAEGHAAAGDRVAGWVLEAEAAR